MISLRWCLAAGWCAALLPTAVGPVRAAEGQPALLEGRLMDPADKLQRALQLPGRCAELTQAHRERTLRHLDALGYEVPKVGCHDGRLVIQLEPHRVIRKMYMKGNWPLFEEEILRRLRFRPGLRLPDGEDLEQAKQRQEERIKLYLSRQGYFDGSLKVYPPEPTGDPNVVDLAVRVLKGRRYKVGEVVTKIIGPGGGRSRRGRADRVPPEEQDPIIPRDEIAAIFRHDLWFYELSFNTKRFEDDVKTLVGRYHERGYPGVRIRSDFEVIPGAGAERQVRIILEIQPRKKINIRYEGNEHLGASELRKALTLFEEGAYDDYELARSASQIHRLYQSKGYLQARVRFVREVGRAADEVTFKIRPGPHFRIEEVQFRGNSIISDAALRKVVKTKPFPLLGHIGLGEGGYITLTQLQQDVARVKEHYRKQGFPYTEVRGQFSPSRELFDRPGALAAAVGTESGGGDLFVRFDITEGARMLVEEVHISGNRIIDARRLLEQLALKPGRPFTPQALELDKARLARIYGEKGHPYAEIRSLEELSVDGSKVTVQYTVDEKTAVQFGPIFIRGNFKTRRSVIMSDIGFAAGQPFDIRAIEAAERRLRARHIFNVVRVQLLGLSAQQQEVPVLIAVEERFDDFGAFELGVGGSTDNLLFGSIAYTSRNLLGFGTSLSLRGEIGMKIQSGNLHYRDPRIFGSEVTLDIQGYIRNQLTERLGEVRTFGLSTTVSKQLLPHLNGLLRYEIRQVKHKDELHRPAGYEDSRQVDVYTRTGAVGPALVYDRRDNQLSPTRGFKLHASLLYATEYLGGTTDFLKVNAGGQAFIPLPKDITIAFSTRYDHAFPLRGAVTLPKIERFYAGGDTTIRGFDEDRAATEIIPAPYGGVPGATLYRIRPRGGNIRLLSNLELQIPLWQESILFGLPLVGALFIDNGVVTNSFDAFEVSDLRHGAGAALRIITPVGFSSFEYAFPLDPGVGDNVDSIPGKFHFNFGFVF